MVRPSTGYIAVPDLRHFVKLNDIGQGGPDIKLDTRDFHRYERLLLHIPI
jgi:hypothetical protein